MNRGRGRLRPGEPSGFVARPGQIRQLGPMAALAVPAVLLTLAGLVFFAWPCDGAGCVKTSLLAYLLILLAAPTALICGLPWILNAFTIGAAAVSSAVMWLVLGRWSARRATVDADATWRTFGAELLFMIGGVWGGIIVGLAAVGLWLSH